MTEKIDGVRREYTLARLEESCLPGNPMALFDEWLQASLSSEMIDPTAMVLATVSEAGFPSQRTVLLKGVTEGGFQFFTNYDSNKGREIAARQKVSLHFPWHLLERQVIVKGVAQKLERAESEAYFQSRPRTSQLAAVASLQSRPIAGRQALLERLEKEEKRFENASVIMPSSWGGYLVSPLAIEFWQGGEKRLHDRIIYTLDDAKKWRYQRLMP